ncbi:sporulation integral membrane protein YlbJ [Clostridium sp. SYSU_GA19001]|uniref:sporulation integral membrane protein YlbJ n=1 Tax=Clostridium caldaquaticum TaxID=2940653 RepID=UPI0020770955|nr:sporulation integral membrane protein YlbJ [Clostridium caldaquaticum]MCM8710586.1 sporulation integral membrane protein YlbJ [Clostridium caldaquaticum]
MNLLLYAIFLLILVLLYFLLKSLEQNLVITIICSLIIIQIVLTPKLCIDSALLGANLFINRVFPSLFPFLVVTSIMMDYNGVHIYSKFFGKILCKPLRLPLSCTFVLIVSMLCGYPLGAKYACELYEQEVIDYKTCERLVNIASNASPLFVIGAVGTSMLKNSNIGYLLLISNYISCFIMALIITQKDIHKKNSLNGLRTVPSKNIGNIIKNSIENSIKTCLSIGGFVILFSVLTNIIKNNLFFNIIIEKITNLLSIDKNILEGFILGLIEITNGCYLISTTSKSMYIKAIIISFFLGFSGLSIISQVYSFTYKHNLSLKKYTIRKVLQGFICSTITLILYRISLPKIAIQTSNIKTNTNLWSSLLITCIIILIIPFLFNKLKKLFYTS